MGKTNVENGVEHQEEHGGRKEKILLSMISVVSAMIFRIDIIFMEK